MALFTAERNAKKDNSHWIFATCLQLQTVSKLKLAMQIPLKCPHPNLLPPGEGTTSPLGEGWDEGFPPFATTLRRRAQKRRALSLTMTATPTPSPTTPSATDALVSWQGRLFEAKESGCEILDAPGQSFGLRPVCSLIRSRSVVFNSNSYLSGGFQKDPTSSHLQGGVFP